MQLLKLPDKERLIETINSIEDLNGEIIDKLVNIINENYRNAYELKRYRIKKIRIEKNKSTVYTGLNVTLDSSKPITIIIGINNTGKTTSFEKLLHFFSDYKKEKSSINKLITKFELILIDKQEKNQEYSIKYHSNFGLDGQRFQISKQILDEKNNVRKTTVIQNPEEFLKKNLLIDYNLNESIFVHEIPGESFVSKFCITEEKFRELFRFPIIDILFKTLSDHLQELDKEIKRTSNFLNAYQIDLNNNHYKLNNVKRDRKKDKLLVDNENELSYANQEFNKISLEIKEKADEELKKYRAKKIELAKKKEVLKELEKFNPDLLNDKFDALYQIISNYCFECSSIILPDEFKKRVKDDRCYVCGIGNRDYSLEFEVLPKNYENDFKDNKNKLIEEIKKIKNEINKFLVNKQDILHKPNDINEKIWKEVQFAANIEEEIISAKERFQNYDININTINQKIKEIEDYHAQYEEKLKELENEKSAILELYEKLSGSEEEIFKKLKERIFKLVNSIIIELTVENIGALDFDGKGNLVVINSAFKNEEKKDYEDKTISYKDSKKKLSPGILRKIDLAFSLALLFINRDDLIRPLNILILDSLNYLDIKDIKLLLGDLATKTDYQILVFNTEKPQNLAEETSKTVEIIRNPLMRKPNAVKNIIKKTNLTQFL